jgi:hypothetical protein
MKPFDQALYDADDNAKQLVIIWLHKHGWNVYTNPDIYGVDLIGHDPLNRPVTVEVEVKHHWTTNTFPFKTVHVSARKRKFIEPRAYLVMLNHQRTHALTFDFKDLVSAPTITKSTIYTTNEQFLELPVGRPRRLQ